MSRRAGARGVCVGLLGGWDFITPLPGGHAPPDGGGGQAADTVKGRLHRLGAVRRG